MLWGVAGRAECQFRHSLGIGDRTRKAGACNRASLGVGDPVRKWLSAIGLSGVLQSDSDVGDRTRKVGVCNRPLCNRPLHPKSGCLQSASSAIGLFCNRPLLQSASSAAIGLFGVDAFDLLERNQKLALLAFVATALTDEAVPWPMHTAHNEATIAAFFSNIVDQVTFEIDFAAERQELDDPTAMRKLVLAAYLEVWEPDSNEEPVAVARMENAHAGETPTTCQDEDEDDLSDSSLPAADSTDLEKWKDLIDTLANRILWDDGDYEGLS